MIPPTPPPPPQAVLALKGKLARERAAHSATKGRISGLEASLDRMTDDCRRLASQVATLQRTRGDTQVGPPSG